MTGGRVLVTGGCGFIGSRLVADLLADGDDVAVVDDLSLGSAGNLPSDAVGAVDLVEADVRDRDALVRVLAERRPTTVVHMAAIHFIPACEADPLACVRVNVEGTQALLEACARTESVEAVVLASSAAVYRPSEAAHREDDALGPTDIYGHSKLWSEQLARLFRARSGVPVGIARFFNVYGPGETNPHFIPTVLRQAEQGDEISLGDLTTRRDYVFVGDVSEAVRALARACRHHGELTCNVGTGRGHDGNEVLEAVAKVLGRRVRARTEPARLRPSDRPSLLSDPGRSRELLGWEPRTSLEDGLREALLRPVGTGLTWR